MADRSFDADIIIAGAGPSGLMVGNETAIGGLKIIILEKRTEPSLTRAGTLGPRVLEIFASRGMIDSFMERAFELHTDPRTPKGLWAGLSGPAYHELSTDYPYVLMFPQIETERLLGEHFTSRGGDIRRGCEVIGVDQDEESVTVRYRTIDGEEHCLRSRYLVGCDGGRSAVRKELGIEFAGRPAGRLALNVDAYANNPYPQNLTVSNSEHGWAMSYPLRDGLMRFAMIDAATCRDISNKQPDFEEALAMLRRVHGTDFGIQKVHSINTFHDALYMATQLRKGRAFLVGESVRIHYPASGVGMQFCLQDAFNLGWKLAYVARGDAPEWLLDSFVAERKPEIERLLNSVRTQCAIQFNFDDEHIALKNRLESDFLTIPEVNRRICEENSGLSVRYPSSPNAHDLVGRRFPNLALRTEGGGADTVFSMLRDQKFALVDLTGESILPVIATGLPVVAVSLASPVAEELAGIASVMLRPDGHVAWSGNRPLSEYVPWAELSEWIPMAAKSPAADVGGWPAV